MNIPPVPYVVDQGLWRWLVDVREELVTEDGQSEFDSFFAGKTTTDLPEGDNLYYTDSRVDARVAAINNGEAEITLNDDHSALSNLSSDDHLQYHTDVRALTWLGTRTTTDLDEGDNLYFTTSRFNASFDNKFLTKTADDLAEGTVNKYFTTARFNTEFATKTTTNLPEGTNLYWTDSRFDTRFALKTTDDLAEGAVNFYYTEPRFDASLAGTPSSEVPQFWVRTGTDLTTETAGDTVSLTGAFSTVKTTGINDLTVGTGNNSRAAVYLENSINTWSVRGQSDGNFSIYNDTQRALLFNDDLARPLITGSNSTLDLFGDVRVIGDSSTGNYGTFDVLPGASSAGAYARFQDSTGSNGFVIGFEDNDNNTYLNSSYQGDTFWNHNNITFNSGALDADFTFNKQTSGAWMTYVGGTDIVTFDGAEINLDATINEAKLGTQPNGNDDDSIATIKYVDDVLAGGGGTLSALADTEVADRVNDDLLVYRPTLGDWQATTPMDEYLPWGSGVTEGDKGQWSWTDAGLLRWFYAVDTYADFYTKDDVDGLIGGTDELNELDDVTITTPAANHLLIYSGSVWENQLACLDLLDDVTITSAGQDDILKYNETLAIFENITPQESYVPSASITTEDSDGDKGQWSYENGKLYFCIADDTWVEITASTSFSI